jgi:hypothetical protein
MRRLARRARYLRIKYSDICEGIAWIARNPADLREHPQWLRQRGPVTMRFRVPWWPYDVPGWVAGMLPAQPRVFEYGGGGSTLWLEDLGASVTVAEHNKEWHDQLAEVLSADTRLLLRPSQESGVITSAVEPGYFDSYAAAIDGESDASLDMVIVDGRARVDCVRHAIPKVKPGGLLLLDDTDRPRYRAAVTLLEQWDRHVFTGLKPGSHRPAQTSAWRRPG